MVKRLVYIILSVSVLALAFSVNKTPVIKVSANHRFFTANGKPFFWLGDTGWLLLTKLSREDAEKYLDIRKRQGFTVIQVMVVHDTKDVNFYGDSALTAKSIAHPKVTPGSNPDDAKQYDYWDHMEWVIKKAQEKGLYVALVPVWGSVVKQAHITPEQGKIYATFLAKRFRSYPNIIWMNGGDIAGSDHKDTWNAIGNTLRALDPVHLITYHPRGRTTSSLWFHNESWLNFNSFQSGHRTYAQDTSKNDLRYGEDNWRYVQRDYAKKPAKPTIDAEPSYERIPHGLHDTLQPRWTDADVRRYAYWSVFAGACGFTYGNNDVMQFHVPSDKHSAYGSKEYWYNSINDPGAEQMKYLEKLMLSRPYFERVPDQSLIVGDAGQKYERLIATRGKKYAFIYTYTGRQITVNTQKLQGQRIKASWFNPRNGNITAAGTFNQSKSLKFNPPDEPKEGNDWVLVLDAR